MLPLEDDEPLDAANPVTADGQVRFDALKVQARHDAIVKNALKGSSFGLMILGGDHDLSENVRRLGAGQCEYVRVTMKRYREEAGNGVVSASGQVVHDHLDIHERVIIIEGHGCRSFAPPSA